MTEDSISLIRSKLYNHTIISVGVLSFGGGKAYNSLTGDKAWNLLTNLAASINPETFRTIAGFLLIAFLVVLLILERRISILEAEINE